MQLQASFLARKIPDKCILRQVVYHTLVQPMLYKSKVPILYTFCFILQKTLEHFHVIYTFVFLMKIIILHTCTRHRLGSVDSVYDLDIFKSKTGYLGFDADN